MALASPLLLSAAIAGAVTLEDRDSVEGLVVHDLAPPVREAPAEQIAA